MINASLKGLCLMSLFCGAALSICPEGSVKRLMNVLITAILILTLLMPLKDFDFSKYALYEEKIAEREEVLSQNGTELNDRLNRLVIEQEYETYIMDKAAKLQMEVSDVKVGVFWSTEGLWLPESLSLKTEASADKQKRLRGIVSADLGIAPERQYFNGNE